IVQPPRHHSVLDAARYHSTGQRYSIVVVGTAARIRVDQLDGCHQAETSDFADLRQRVQLAMKLVEEPGADFGSPLYETFAFDDRDVSQTHRAAHRMAGVRRGMHELQVCRSLVHCVLDLAADHHSAKRQVRTGDPFGEADDVRLDLPVVEGEPRPGATEAGDDLV